MTHAEATRFADLDPDVRLMLRVRDDDAAAFEQLVCRYQSRLLTVLHHLVGDRDRAEDLAQDVFLRLFRARKRYQPEARFATFIFAIAHNVARNALRTLARRKEVQVPGATSPSQSMVTLEEMAKEASALMPARQLDQAEAVEMLNMVLRQLNERQRLAVLLCKFEGMSYAEIAQTMQLTPQAIKSLLSRARSNLRDAMRPYQHEGHRPLMDSETAPQRHAEFPYET